jgi:hypothetical protein
MSDEMTIAVFCTDCNAPLPSEWAHQVAPENVCPRCGSIKTTINMNIVDDVGLEVHDSLRARAKDITMPSKKNPRVDIFAGDDLRKSDNKWMTKERVIDKDKDLYREIVKDPTTGVIVHHNEEPLSQHFGHGSAKFKTKP